MLIVFAIYFVFYLIAMSAKKKVEGATGSKFLGVLTVIGVILLIAALSECGN
ncbi:MAG: hypothetical protein IK080_04555 [Clostridia bacterium]|nr:hypothetical protein [Clostridia bacterium]